MSTTYQDLPKTNFPDSQDTFVTYQNVDSSNKKIVDKYLDYMNKGQFANAQTYYNNNKTVLDKVIINEDVINTIGQCITAIERFYHSDVRNYMNAITETRNVVPIEVV